MASSSFRDSMNSLGWSRREEAPIDTSQQSGLLSSIKSLNPFGGDGYVQLPTTEGPGAPLPAPNRREEEEGFFALSRWDRILIFSGCNVGALACFVICFALFPVMALKPRKFAILSPCHPSLARYGALLRQHAHAPNHDRANEPASRPFAHASSASPTIMGVGVCGAFLCDSLAHSEWIPSDLLFSLFDEAPTVHAPKTQKTHRRLTPSPDL
ncbi:hypothetical protein V501_06337 [Pseudogymnoascus sp. VKM F-4519 (FW-2642)]|nr:hypothetical protein V501_06337 [Pseudogymnoascus sp. VKM F-4519 (FW-2642)]